MENAKQEKVYTYSELAELGKLPVKLVRPYVANDVTDKVEAYLQPKLDAKAKEEAQEYLNSTDWYITRKAETGVEVPAEVLTKRQECRELL